MVNILIGADIVPTKSNEELFIEANIEKLLGKELLKLMEASDYTVLNLETPLTNSPSPIVKTGPCLYAAEETIDGLKAINRDFYTLANNHILDQGIKGLATTTQLLDAHGISYAGVGKNIEEARKPFIKRIGNLSVGIYCCAENEFSVATDETAGANPYDPLFSFDDVKNLSSKCDVTIVLYHGGKEHYRYPSPQLQRVFRKFAESGADYIIGQHSHCISCFEEYRGSLLLYGQGNFLFDYSNDEHWQTSVMLSIDIDETSLEKRYDFIPLSKKENTVRLAKAESDFLQNFYERSKRILSSKFLDEQHAQFAKRIEIDYYYALLGKIGRSKVFRGLNKLTGYRLVKHLYSKKERTLIENFVACEAHQEVLLKLLRR